MTTQRVIILSDTHIGSGPLDDFDSILQEHLCRFLDQWAKDPSAIEIVINGDFLEFVQASPWEGHELRSHTVAGLPLCFTQDQSLTKLDAIVLAHSPVFDALGKFLAAKEENRLTILPGNHDADLFWPAVHTRLTERISGGKAGLRQQVIVHLEQVYRPASRPSLWIEHGHQHDPCNSFFVDQTPRWSAATPPIQTDKEGRERLLECVGTRFLLRYLNRLDRDYPFVDNIKPLSRFVTLFTASSFLSGHAALRAVVALWGLSRFLGVSAGSPSDLLGLNSSEATSLGNALAKSVEKMTDTEQGAFAAALRSAGFGSTRPLLILVSDPEGQVRLLNFLAEHPELADGLADQPESNSLLSLDGGAGELTLTKGFVVDETRELKRVARNILVADRTVEAVVMGHTHEVVDFSERLAYANTGCWIRYYQFGDGEMSLRWPLLRDPTYELFPYWLLYVDAVPGATPRLATFDRRTK